MPVGPVDRRVMRLRFLLQCKRHFHLHIGPFYTHFHTRDTDLGILRPLTRPNIEPPSVPGAFDQVAIKTAFAQWSARVRAGVVHGAKRSIDVAEREEDPVDFNGATGPGRDLIHLGDGDVIGVRAHGVPLQITGWSGLPQPIVTFWLQLPKRLISLVAYGIDESGFLRGRIVTAPPFAIL